MRLKSSLFAVFVLTSIAAVFWLPTVVPMPLSGSISYTFGFYNRAALIAYLVVLAVGCFALKGVDLDPPVVKGRRNADFRTLLLGLAATCACCGLIYLVARPTGGIDEAPYLITRLRLLASGKRPYLDFEFLYGPFLLYFPLWISRLLRMGLTNAYMVAWVLQWCLGVAAEFFIIEWLEFPLRHRKQAFWILWSAFLSFIVNNGATYTPFRELAALFCILATHRIYSSGRKWLGFGFAVLATAMLFALSPEIGFAFSAGVALYLGLSLEWRRPGYVLGYALMLGGLVLVCRGAGLLHEMDSAKEFSGGGADIPLILTPTSLFILTGVFVAGAFGVNRLRARKLLDPRVAAVVITFCLLPGAFGRSDPSHLLIYSVGALLAVLVLAARRDETWRWTAGLFLVLCSLALLGSKLNIDKLMVYNAAVRVTFPQGRAESALAGLVQREVQTRLGPVALAKMMKRSMVAPQDPHVEFPGATAVVQAPFGYSVRGYASVLRPDVELGYFDGFNDVMGPRQIEHKIAEMDWHPERDLLLPLDFNPSCPSDPQAAINMLRVNYGYDYLHRAVHEATMIRPLCQYIQRHYALQAEPADNRSLYALWKRR